jgi:HTH-type transcriptional regulator / antitoxin HigA
LLGSRSRASEVLNLRRALTVDMIHKLHVGWGLPAENLIKPYQLAAA